MTCPLGVGMVGFAMMIGYSTSAAAALLSGVVKPEGRIGVILSGGNIDHLTMTRIFDAAPDDAGGRGGTAFANYRITVCKVTGGLYL